MEARRLAGLATDRTKRAIIGRYAKALLAHNWDATVVIAAVREYAATRKHPRFLEEWVRRTYWKWQDAEHVIRLAEGREPIADPRARAILERTRLRRLTSP